MEMEGLVGLKRIVEEIEMEGLVGLKNLLMDIVCDHTHPHQHD